MQKLFETDFMSKAGEGKSGASGKCEVCGHEHYLLCEVVVSPEGDICCCDAYLYDHKAGERKGEEKTNLIALETWCRENVTGGNGVDTYTQIEAWINTAGDHGGKVAAALLEQLPHLPVYSYTRVNLLAERICINTLEIHNPQHTGLRDHQAYEADMYERQKQGW